MARGPWQVYSRTDFAQRCCSFCPPHRSAKTFPMCDAANGNAWRRCDWGRAGRFEIARVWASDLDASYRE